MYRTRVSWAALGLLLVSAWVLYAPKAQAYAWMIRHDYAGCNQCHADPSGGGLLTAYGRAQGELLLRTRYGGATEEPGRVADFLFGVVKLPDSLLLGGDARVMRMHSDAIDQTIWMQLDLQGEITVGRLHANASVGYVPEGALPAAVTNAAEHNVVSRLHWVGYDLDQDGAWMVRAGRMNLPFGIRFVEHTFLVRAATRTDTNDQQQHGVSLAYNGELLRGEIMAVIGNFQEHPDMYRSRGAVGFVEARAGERLSVGASALILHSERDLALSSPAYRHAYGPFVRYAPWAPLVVMAEGDLLFQSKPNGVNRAGYVSTVSTDLEVLQGVHIMATGEVLNSTPSRSDATYTAQGGVAWFFAPHADTRLDAVWQSTPDPLGGDRTSSTTLLAQLHLFL